MDAEEILHPVASHRVGSLGQREVGRDEEFAHQECDQFSCKNNNEHFSIFKAYQIRKLSYENQKRAQSYYLSETRERTLLW